MFFCDVCETLLIIDGELDLEDEEIKIVCPECGYDNTYQFFEPSVNDQILDYLDATEIQDDDMLLQALAERFGMDIELLSEMIEEKEMLGWDIRVRRR